jgi:hypothetical protein
MEKRQPLQQMLLGKVVIHLQKSETRPLVSTKITKFCQIQNSQVGTGKSRHTMEVIGIAKDFLNRTPAAQ